jgi:hypothetical protein
MLDRAESVFAQVGVGAIVASGFASLFAVSGRWQWIYPAALLALGGIAIVASFLSFQAKVH